MEGSTASPCLACHGGIVYYESILRYHLRLRNWTVWVGDGARPKPLSGMGLLMHPSPSNTDGQLWSGMGLLAHMVQKLAGRYWTGMGPASFLDQQWVDQSLTECRHSVAHAGMTHRICFPFVTDRLVISGTADALDNAHIPFVPFPCSQALHS
jgi:hypothetical protein